MDDLPTLGVGIVLAMLCCAAGSCAATLPCIAASGARTMALVELYTSEGCDSCPPADRWLSARFPPGSDADAVPLAFHVDYWDRLGWKDRFAASAWTERQYALAHAAHSTLVYTPQVVVQGRELRDWAAPAKVAAALQAAASRVPAADVALEVAPRAGELAVTATARVKSDANRSGTALFVALTDSGLTSAVKAGENAGRTLRHDHVVREIRGPIPVDAAGAATGKLVLRLPQERGSASAVVAFVQNASSGEVLQALALPLGSDCMAAR